MKERTGKECKRKNCVRYESYNKWNPLTDGSALRICMACKNAYVSQYTPIKKG